MKKQNHSKEFKEGGSDNDSRLMAETGQLSSQPETLVQVLILQHPES
jgi:hypothetical protein